MGESEIASEDHPNKALHLQAREVTFSWEELRHFLAAVWDLVHPRDTHRLWADAFLKITAHRAPA